LVSTERGVGPVSLSVRAGEVVTLVGLIGAGRTETVRMIYGADLPDSGSVRLHGKDVSVQSATDALKVGIGLLPESRKEQALFASRDVVDNITITSLKSKSRFG